MTNCKDWNYNMDDKNFSKLTYDQVIAMREDLVALCEKVSLNDKRLSLLEYINMSRADGGEKKTNYTFKIVQLILYIGMFIIALKGILK